MKNKGITLIALVVTIVVLLILAGVSITAVFGERGIIDLAKEIANKTEDEENQTIEDLNSLESEVGGVLGKETPDPEAKKVESIQIVPNTLNLYIGKKQTLIAEVTPKEAVKKDVLWRSSNDEIIKVNEKTGEIEAKQEGKANIIAKSTDGSNIEGKCEVRVVYEGFDAVKGVNIPQLGEGMTGVKWDEAKKDWVEITGVNDPDWYNYKEKKWANAVIKDKEGKIESYWVWIPRYAYCIKSGYHSITAGTIDIKFLQGISDTAEDGTKSWANKTGEGNWNIHPAFENGSSNNYANGEWKEKIQGIWVAKFTASNENCTTTDSTGSTNTNNTSLKLQIKPGITTWRGINISNIYIVCKNYNPGLNSHLMKNSEWGAVAYLSKSIDYGQGNTMITNNDNSAHLAGGGIENEYATKNTAQSTTGNQWGIYDMAAGNYFEYVASYLDYNIEKNNTNEALINETEGYRKQAYKQLIGGNGAQDDYEKNKEIYGDAIWETSSSYTGYYSWLGVNSVFVYIGAPIFRTWCPWNIFFL